MHAVAGGRDLAVRACAALRDRVAEEHDPISLRRRLHFGGARGGDGEQAQQQKQRSGAGGHGVGHRCVFFGREKKR